MTKEMIGNATAAPTSTRSTVNARNGDSARTFTAMITLGQALEAAKSTDPEKIRTALQATNVTIAFRQKEPEMIVCGGVA